jgi:excisionase family DNA binding protein
MGDSPPISVDVALRQLVHAELRDVLRTELEPLRTQLAALAAASPPALVTVDVAAERLGKSPSSVRAMCARGELPARRVGRSWRIDMAALRPASPETISRLAREAREP